MRTMILTLLAIGFLSACAGNKGDQGDVGDVGPMGPTGPSVTTTTVPPSAVDEDQADIDEIISYKNEERAVTAQAPLTKGLSCVVQQVASGQCLSSASTAAGCNSGNVVVMTGTAWTYLYKGSFNQPDTNGTDNLLPEYLRAYFLGKNYRISCTGYIVVLDSDYYDFTLNSDDGSILTIAGSQIINNDNNHGMTLKSGFSALYRGVQSFSLQYAQTGGGNHGLILQRGAASIDPKYYYH